MNNYQIEITASAEKEFDTLPSKSISSIIKAIDNLYENSPPYNSIKLEDTENIYRMRVGNYRIVYEIDDKSKLILITRIRHRNEAYR